MRHGQWDRKWGGGLFVGCWGPYWAGGVRNPYVRSGCLSLYATMEREFYPGLMPMVAHGIETRRLLRPLHARGHEHVQHCLGLGE